ncbi:MAG: hypothetical protein LUO89_02280 [Methanothrix sp.]|nr:hypothetical protein [Methanothrix sp.]
MAITASAICKKKVAMLKMLSGCFLMCLLAALPAAAQGVSLTCQSTDMAGYADADFCLPTWIPVIQEDLAEANYTGGREVKALLLFDESEVYLHLLYPCTIRGVSELEIKSQIEAYDPHIKAAGYGTQPITISGLPAIWGRTGNWTFVAYQPADNVLALIYFESSLPAEIGSSFLNSLNINVNQTVSPLYLGYCAQTGPMRKALPIEAYQNASTYNQKNMGYNQQYSQGSEAEARTARFEVTKERMTSEMEDTKERLEETKERLDGYGVIPSPFIQT